MKSAAAYVTHTLIGPIPHLRVESDSGPIFAPVKLITDGKRLITSHYGHAQAQVGFPVIHNHRFIHALPSGGEIPGEAIGYFDEQRYLKRREDLIKFWNSASHVGVEASDA
jgi:hypothetical protein